MIKFASLLGLLGLAAATLLIVWSGYQEVLIALGQAGWGIVWTSLFHLVPMILCVIGWQALIPGKNRPSWLFFLYVLWYRASVNNLLPVARIGGEVLAVRIMIKRGVRKSLAIASIVVEITLSIIAQFFFVLIGVGLFLMKVSDNDVTAQLLLGLLLTAVFIGLLLLVQRVGFFGILHKLFVMMFREKWKNFAVDTTRLDRTVFTMYRRQRRALFCGVMQFLSWVACSGEIWLALYFLGHPLPILECVMIEALIQATWGAAFMVPGAIGVQEAGFLLFGHLLGLTPEVAGALAIIRRCRDLLLYVPGLLSWQVEEGRWMIQKSDVRRQKTEGTI
jgi:glycosyltransferase 2 family protein